MEPAIIRWSRSSPHYSHHRFAAGLNRDLPVVIASMAAVSAHLNIRLATYCHLHNVSHSTSPLTLVSWYSRRRGTGLGVFLRRHPARPSDFPSHLSAVPTFTGGTPRLLGQVLQVRSWVHVVELSKSRVGFYSAEGLTPRCVVFSISSISPSILHVKGFSSIFSFFFGSQFSLRVVLANLVPIIRDSQKWEKLVGVAVPDMFSCTQ